MFSIKKFNQPFLVNIAIKESRFKLLDRWYLTPKLLGRMFPYLGDNFWKCNQEDADYLHMWWGCPRVHRFWNMVGETLSQIIGANIPMDPRLM